jgi:hypothetical protein
MNFTSYSFIDFSLILLVYLYFSYCLKKIALRLGLENKSWWAWIPILQVVLMLKMAPVPWWWIFLFLIPLVNIAIGITVWVKISNRLQKSFWYGVLMIVPGVDLIILGYLAFSK